MSSAQQSNNTADNSEENEDIVNGSSNSFKDYYNDSTRQDRGKSGDARLARRGADGGKGVNLIPQKYKEVVDMPRLKMLQDNKNGKIVLNQYEIPMIKQKYNVRNMDENGRSLGKTGITVKWENGVWVAEYTG